MSRLTSRLVPPLPCLALAALLIGSAGCTSRVDRPDGQVARIVEREDRRLAQQTAVAAIDLDPLEFSSSRLLVEAMGLLSVQHRWSRGAVETPDEPLGAAEGWDYQPPPSWMIQPWPFVTAGDLGWMVDANLSKSSGGGDRGGSVSDEGAAGDGRREGGKDKPKLRLNLLRMRINDRPVSFSGSMKGMKGVQLKATIKL